MSVVDKIAKSLMDVALENRFLADVGYSETIAP
jgi:hypothetical protein